MKRATWRALSYTAAFGAGFALGVKFLGDWVTAADADARGEKGKKPAEKGLPGHQGLSLGEKAARREIMLDSWLMAKKYGTPMEEYLLKKGIRRVIIYGTQSAGLRLYHELKDTPIEIVCSYDRNPKQLIYGVENYKKPDAAAHPADAVIVANFLLFDEIENALREAGYTNIIGLDELIFELLKDGGCEDGQH